MWCIVDASLGILTSRIEKTTSIDRAVRRSVRSTKPIGLAYAEILLSFRSHANKEILLTKKKEKKSNNDDDDEGRERGGGGEGEGGERWGEGDGATGQNGRCIMNALQKKERGDAGESKQG
jgi:hypothetical protein